MADYTLYCFAQSGHSYKVASYLALAGLDWSPRFVDFFAGEARSPEFRDINAMGECPVLVHGDLTLSQSGVILDYLVAQTGHFAPANASDAREVLRWVLWDNHKGSSQFGTTRFMLNFLAEKHRNEAVNSFMLARSKAALATLNAHLNGRDWMVGTAPSVADLCCSSYLFYPEPFGFERADLPHIDAWLTRIKALPNWQHPYDLMPGHPLPGTA
ncbi:MAG: glutathione S-transferase [Paracoccaceae bacterium]